MKDNERMGGTHVLSNAARKVRTPKNEGNKGNSHSRQHDRRDMSGHEKKAGGRRVLTSFYCKHKGVSGHWHLEKAS